MFTITVNDIERIFQDYGIYEHCAGFSELQRYHYEEDDPDSKEVRLIVKAETNSGMRPTSLWIPSPRRASLPFCSQKTVSKRQESTMPTDNMHVGIKSADTK
mgnify:CR=1 FL=1